MGHISVISCRNPINLYITEKLILKFSKSLCNFYLVISNKYRERMPCFPIFVFPLRSSKSDVLHQILHFHIKFDTICSPKPCQRFFEKMLCLYFTAKTPK